MISEKKSPAQVLLADPDEETRNLIKNCIQSFAPETIIFEATTPSEALALALDHKMDLACLELKTKNFDGMDLMHSLKDMSLSQRPQHLLVYSELLESNASQHSTRLTSFLHKPLPIAALTQFLTQKLQTLEIPLNPRPTPQIDATLFNDFNNGVIYFFTQVLDTDIGRQHMTLRKQEWLISDVGATLPLRCSLFEGQMVLTMNLRCFLDLTNQILKTKHQTLLQDNLNALLRTITDIFDFSKINITNRGIDFENSTPKPVHGNQCRFPPPESGEIRVHYQYQSFFGEFQMEIQLDRIAPQALSPLKKD